jgi:hypothetical protein
MLAYISLLMLTQHLYFARFGRSTLQVSEPHGAVVSILKLSRAFPYYNFLPQVLVAEIFLNLQSIQKFKYFSSRSYTRSNIFTNQKKYILFYFLKQNTCVQEYI